MDTAGSHRGFSVSGHADSKPFWARYLPWNTGGRDIVCAAVSAVTGAAVLGLLELVPECGELSDCPDSLSYKVINPTLESETIMKVLKLGIMDIRRQYPGQIEVDIREESHGS